MHTSTNENNALVIQWYLSIFKKWWGNWSSWCFVCFSFLTIQIQLSLFTAIRSQVSQYRPRPPVKAWPVYFQLTIWLTSQTETYWMTHLYLLDGNLESRIFLSVYLSLFYIVFPRFIYCNLFCFTQWATWTKSVMLSFQEE